MSHYHYQMYPNLGEDKCKLGRIPFFFAACTYQLYHAWIPGGDDPEQPRCASVTECKYK